MLYKKKSIIGINESTGERREFPSINAAAKFLESTFKNIQAAAIYNGYVKGWRIYESADTIRQHIKDLQEQLKIIEK